MPGLAIHGRLRARRVLPWGAFARAGSARGVATALWLTGWALGLLVAP